MPALRHRPELCFVCALFSPRYSRLSLFVSLSLVYVGVCRTRRLESVEPPDCEFQGHSQAGTKRWRSDNASTLWRFHFHSNGSFVWPPDFGSQTLVARLWHSYDSLLLFAYYTPEEEWIVAALRQSGIITHSNYWRTCTITMHCCLTFSPSRSLFLTANQQRPGLLYRGV